MIGHFLPDRASFPHLPHPPFQIPMGMGNLTWGQHLPDLLVRGIIGADIVAEQRIAADSLPHALNMVVDSDQLWADGADMTQLSFTVVDRYGNHLPYVSQAVTIEVIGPAEIIGPNPLILTGGQGAVYIRAGYNVGQITIRATTARLLVATGRLTIEQEIN